MASDSSQGGESVKERVSVLLLVCALCAGLGQGWHGERDAVPGDEQSLLAAGGSIERGIASILPGLPAAEFARPSRDGGDEAAPDGAPFALPQRAASILLAWSHYSVPAAEPCEFHPPVRGPPTA